MKNNMDWFTLDISVEDAKINIMQTIADQKTKEILDTKDELVRNALIEMGWTPPPN